MTLEQPVTDGATNQSGDNSVKTGDRTKDGGGPGHGEGTDACEKCWYPGLKTTHGEGVHCQSQGCGDEGAISDQAGKSGADGGRVYYVCATARRFGQKPERQREEKTRNSGHHEGRTPIVKVLPHGPPEQIADGCSEGQSCGKDGHHASAAFEGKQISNQRGSNGSVAGFANADQYVTHHQLIEGVGDRSEEGEAAPNHDTHGDDVPAAVAIP